MSIHDVTAENLASLFFHYQAALAADFGCAPQGSAGWAAMPANERRRMIAAARLTLLDLSSDGIAPEAATETKVRGDHRGEEGREWGC
jgi:hypothetical protein